MTKNFTSEFDNDDLYEHHRVVATDGQVPLRVDKFLMNFIENATRNKLQQAAKAGNILVNDISNTNWKCVKIVNSLGAPNGVNSHVATLWRHLSYWPNLLNEVIHSFEKISMNGDIINTQNEVLNYVNNNGINLKRQKFKYTYINNLALETIRDYVNTNNQVIRMVVLGNIMKKWLGN